MFFSREIFQKSPKFYNGDPHSKLMVSLGSGSRFWRFSMVFHEFSLKKMVFKVLPTHIDAEFHGESISDGSRAIRERKVGEKLKKPRKKLPNSILRSPSCKISLELPRIPL